MALRHAAPKLLALLIGLLLALVAGCAREVAAGLDEPEANRAIVALARAGVDAEKASDPQSEGKYHVVVGRDEATIAISVLAAEEIPRAKPPTAVGGGLVPSPEAERAARIAATCAQIERSLASIDGVHDARVHLDVPVSDPLVAALGAAPEKLPQATASVLLRYRGASAPIAVDEVKRVVAGAVSGLAPEAVAVVQIQVPKAALAGDRELAHVGPIAVARGSLGTLRAAAVGVLLAIALLGSAILVLAVRLRRAKDEAADLGETARNSPAR